MVFLGGLWRLNERYAWMSLRSYRVESADPALEQRFWDIFPSRCLRFWPFFIRKSQDIGEFLERTSPIIVRTRMTGLGSFSTEIKLLSPWLIVKWRGQTWCLSREGRMWNTSDGTLSIRQMEIPKKPLWIIPELTAASSGDQALPKGVFPSIFSTEPMEGFLAGFGKESWFKDIQEIVLDRRAGADLFRFKLVFGKQEFMVLVQRDKYGWRELNIAFEHILERLRKEGGNHLIDATYEDKIVVSALTASTGEGSSK